MKNTNCIENLDPELVELYTSKSIADMIDAPAPKATPILGNGVLVTDSKACIYAKAKVGKSVFAMQMGLCIASGQPFLDDIEVVKPANVLFLNFEVDDGIAEDRILQIKEKLGLGYVANFRKLTLLGRGAPLLDTNQGFERVRNILMVQDALLHPVDVLVWDCRYKTFARSENEDDVMKEWCRNMDELIKTWKFTPIIVHHEGKNTTGIGAGSSVFDRWVNTSIEIRPYQRISALSFSKERNIIIGGNYTEGYEQSMVFDYPIHRIGGHAVWQRPRSKKEEAMEIIIEILEAAPDGKMKQSELWGQAKAREVTSSTFNAAKQELEQSSIIKSEQDPNKAGRYNVIQLQTDPS